MDTLLRSATYIFSEDGFNFNNQTVKVSLYKRDNSFRISHLWTARESDYYIMISGYRGLDQDPYIIDQVYKPEKKYEEWCFFFYRMQEYKHAIEVYEAWGMDPSVFNGGLSAYLKEFDPQTNRFIIGMGVNQSRDYYAKRFNRVSGLQLTADDMYSIEFIMTNDSFTINRIIDYDSNHKPLLRELAKLDNPKDFITMTLQFCFSLDDII